MSVLRVIAVEAASRSYEVVIGRNALSSRADRLAIRAPRGRAVIVADAAALSQHETRLRQAFDAAGVKIVLIAIEGGEGAKSWSSLETLCDRLLALNVERSEPVIAFGGGTIGDLTGFASAILKRGTRFIQIPTTLLAQVDSSVGGKTGINTSHGKNLIGAFHQPDLVIADTAFLDTLPKREVLAGYAEIVKAGLIQDPELFERLEAQGVDAVTGDSLVQAIADAVAFKARIVAEDERESGVRALLNLGHTFGHAFEAEAEKGALIHGEAVACGLALAFRYSVRLGVCRSEDAARVEAHLQAVGLPARISDLPGGPYDAARLLSRMGDDKKNSGGAITLILARGIGDAFITRETDRSDLAAFLSSEVED
jgi:3-dehydroquinate synthase